MAAWFFIPTTFQVSSNFEQGPKFVRCKCSSAEVFQCRAAGVLDRSAASPEMRMDGNSGISHTIYTVLCE